MSSSCPGIEPPAAKDIRRQWHTMERGFANIVTGRKVDRLHKTAGVSLGTPTIESLASMGNCTSERREPNLLRGTRQRRNGSSQHTLSLGWRRDLGIVLGYLGDRTPRSRTVPIGNLLVRVVPTVACHVCPFSGVVGCICSHLCCLFAFCVGENKNENKTNNNDGGVCVGEMDWNQVKFAKKICLPLSPKCVGSMRF